MEKLIDEIEKFGSGMVLNSAIEGISIGWDGKWHAGWNAQIHVFADTPKEALEKLLKELKK